MVEDAYGHEHSEAHVQREWTAHFPRRGGDPEEAYDAAFGLRFEPRAAWEAHVRSAILGGGGVTQPSV